MGRHVIGTLIYIKVLCILCMGRHVIGYIHLYQRNLHQICNPLTTLHRIFFGKIDPLTTGRIRTHQSARERSERGRIQAAGDGSEKRRPRHCNQDCKQRKLLSFFERTDVFELSKCITRFFRAFSIPSFFEFELKTRIESKLDLFKLEISSLKLEKIEFET